MFLQNTPILSDAVPWAMPGLVCVAPLAPLTDGVGSVLDRKVYFPLAGYVGPGFHTWPSGHISQDTAPNPLLRSRPHAKKTFGEAFGAATGVSDPRLQKIRIRNRGAGGKAATVAGYAGPGFHTWPSGHILQDNNSESASTNPVTSQKTFRDTETMRRSFRTRVCFSGGIPRVGTLGWYAMPRQRR